MPVKWMPPSEGWVKMNVDDSCDKGFGSITAGGVIRNHLKEWVIGFVLNKGIGSALEAELWDFFEGLSLLWSAGFRCVIVETDSLAILHLLSQNSIDNHPCLVSFKAAKVSWLQIEIIEYNMSLEKGIGLRMA
ncbi:hypothetical protein LWI28_026719 [Acer negundo]|uniref:RNase H type-1 domain-containing protein n=1 Tax=Acer negundo TaxID=4023 RepID=A0AAD5IP21_ACENE|nr:hypothetical protein LWI28_026719 [Acer negundo]